MAYANARLAGAFFHRSPVVHDRHDILLGEELSDDRSVRNEELDQDAVQEFLLGFVFSYLLAGNAFDDNGDHHRVSGIVLSVLQVV